MSLGIVLNTYLWEDKATVKTLHVLPSNIVHSNVSERQLIASQPNFGGLKLDDLTVLPDILLSLFGSFTFLT